MGRWSKCTFAFRVFGSVNQEDEPTEGNYINKNTFKKNWHASLRVLMSKSIKRKFGCVHIAGGAYSNIVNVTETVIPMEYDIVAVAA